MEKPCNTCGEIKPLDQFHKNYGFKDGYTSKCKKCTNLANKLRTQRNNSLNPLKTALVIDDIEGAEKVLQALGYDLHNKDISVHQQFITRLATKYNID